MSGHTQTHRSATGALEVISRPCTNPKCDKLQIRVDRSSGSKPAPFEWACAYCGQIDEEPATPSRRELEIVRLICDGKSSKEVAVELNVSTKTVETHRSNVMRKLGINCVALLVRWAVKNNVVDRLNPPQPS